VVLALALLGTSAFAGPDGRTANGSRPPTKQELSARVRAKATRFVENKGQWNKQGLFLVSAPNLHYWVTKDGYVLDYHRTTLNGGKGDQGTISGHVVRMRFDGANANPAVRGANVLPGRTDYLLGGRTATGVRSYHEVLEAGVYPGVDVRNYFEGARPRYDLVLHPGANPKAVKMAFEGASSVRVEGKDLVLGTKLGPVKHTKLFAYQVVNGARKQVPASFVQLGKNKVGFELGAYDRSRELVIDPLVYGSYYGGNDGWDWVNAVASEPDGAVYMTGWTQSTQFPIINGPYGFNLQGSRDAFISRFQGDAYNIDYEAFVGGSADDRGMYLSLDPRGSNIWLGGVTNSSNLKQFGTNPLQAAKRNPVDAFLVKFTKDPDQVLIPSYSTYFGLVGRGQPLPTLFSFKGMVCAPNGELILTGETTKGDVPGATYDNTKLGGKDIYLLRTDDTGQSFRWGRYFGGTADDQVDGLAVDPAGNPVIAGTIAVASTGNFDTSTAPDNALFETTAGVFPNGRLIRGGVDIYVSRFAADTGTTLYSAVIGGSGADVTPNEISDAFYRQTISNITTRQPVQAVAVDKEGAAYVIGWSGSFDYPRTRGVYGEGNLLGTAVVTKIRPDLGVPPAAQIQYSTGLRTGNSVFPVGIAVDARGNACITGFVAAGMQWTVPASNSPNPNVPIGHQGAGTIQVTPDAIKGAYTRASGNDVSFIPTQDGWVNVLNATGTDLLYGSYIGGDNDEWIAPPYADPGGDFWVYGSTATFEGYTVNPWKDLGTTQPIQKKWYSELPNTHITPLAWKPTPEPPFTNNFNPDSDQLFGFYKYQGLLFNTVAVVGRADGFVLRFRISIPTVQSVTLTPAVAAGGLNNTINGVVTLAGPAPATGAEINLTLDNASAAAFVGSADPAATTITIDPGATTGTFQITTKPVSTQTNVAVKASYEGNFKVAQLTVVPWLQAISLSPGTLVGGNTATGRVTLSQAAPAGGVTVDLTAVNPGMVSFPNGPQVIVPQGQTSVTFPIKTSGVDAKTSTSVTASILGVSRSAQITLTTANLLNLSFNPSTVAGLGTTVGTLSLDGEAGPNGFTVNLTASRAGYTFPSTLTFTGGQSSRTFTVTTPIEANTVDQKITAKRLASGGYLASTVEGSFTVVNSNIQSFTITPNVVDGGVTAVGTVTLTATAPPSGVVVNLTADQAGIVTLPDMDPNRAGSQIIVPSGASSVDFDLTTQVIPITKTVTITASRSATDVKSATLTVNGAELAITIDPSSVVGGTSTQGTVTLSRPAGANPIVVTLGTSNTAVARPAVTTVTIPAGQSSASFVINTSGVATNTNVDITGSFDGGVTVAATGTLEVRAVGVLDVAFNTTSVRGGQTVSVTITLDSPALAGGTVVNLSATNNQFTVLPASVRVPAGQTTFTFTLTTRRVSRNQLTTLTASAAGASDSASLLVTRGF
jgi:hypothetical protein